MKTRKLGSLDVSEIGAGAMSISANYGPPADIEPGHRGPPGRARNGRDVLRHRRGLRSLYQRGAGRRGARADPRPGEDRYQIRLRIDRTIGLNSRPERIKRGGRRLAQAPQDRPHRPVLPAPRRPERADRGRRRHGQGADQGGQGPAFRSVRTRRAPSAARTLCSR